MLRAIWNCVVLAERDRCDEVGDTAWCCPEPTGAAKRIGARAVDCHGVEVAP